MWILCLSDQFTSISRHRLVIWSQTCHPMTNHFHINQQSFQDTDLPSYDQSFSDHKAINSGHRLAIIWPTIFSSRNNHFRTWTCHHMTNHFQITKQSLSRNNHFRTQICHHMTNHFQITKQSFQDMDLPSYDQPFSVQSTIISGHRLATDMTNHF